MNQLNGSGMVRDYVRAIFRNSGKLVAYNILILLLAVAALFAWPREYRSEAKVWIKIGRENSKLDPTAATGETISIQENDREDEIKSVIDIMGSRGVVERAVNQLGAAVVLGEEPLPGAEEGPKPNPVVESIKSGIGQAVGLIKQIDPISDHEEAVHEILKHMFVDAERKSNVVSVSYDTESPHLAQAVVTALIEQYKAEHARIHKTEGSHTFFGEQLQTLKDRVDMTSEKLRIAKNESGLASVDGHRRFLETQITEVGEAKLTAAQKLAEAKAMDDELSRQLGAQPETIKSEERMVPNTGRDTLMAQLQQVQIERAELQSKHRSHPKLKAIIAQENKLKREMASQTTKARKESTEAINIVHQQLALEHARVKSQVHGYGAMLEKLTEQEKNVLDEIADLNKAEIEIEQLNRKVQLAVSSYMTYAENMEDARVDEELNISAISNVSIAQAPTLQEKPVNPSKLMLAALTLAAMLFGSLALIAGMLIIDDSVNRVSDVAEVVEAPVIVSVPNRREFRHVLH